LDNKKHGKEIRYAPNGNVLQVVEYENGKQILETPND
jgi:antitoxin component YwqK of YwqJK toxin-antitoxin module